MAIGSVGCSMNKVHIHGSQEPRVLNNFATELVSLGDVARDGEHQVTFNNPREGWVLFRTTAWAGRKGRMTVTVALAGGGEEDELIKYEPGDKKTVEVIRYLPQGVYSFRIALRKTELSSLSVRTIPVLIYATLNYPPRLARFGRYDWGWLKRIGMLDSCNTIVSGQKPTISTRLWLAQGKQVTTHVGVPGLHTKAPVTAQTAYEYWIKHPALNASVPAGVLADEFYAAPPIQQHFAAYVSAIRRVIKERPDKTFYAYLGDDSPPKRVGNARKLRPFVEPLAEAGCYFAFERYLQEKSSEKEAEAFFDAALKNEMLEFKKYAPDFASRCVYVMGFLCGPGETLNKNPAINYKVHLDMQFHLMATEPAFEGLRGLEMYLSAYCDEEYLRWCAKLFRHYCIEGRTDRLTNDPYELDHIQNPDFEQGLEGWTIESATQHSVQAGKMAGYGKLQGRYPRENGRGDQFLLAKRDADKPNAFSQQIRNLTPGRFYSVKMITGDYTNPTAYGINRVWIEVEGAEAVPEETIQDAYWTSHGDSVKKFGTAITWFNYHRFVFKSAAPTARLVVCDWYTPTYRKGPVGQETTFNFIEVEPYLMPDVFLE